VTYDPSGRFRIVDNPPLAPAEDFFTKSIVGPFIDTGKTVEYDQAQRRPRIYISQETIREMAEDLGLFDQYREAIIAAEEKSYAIGYAEGVKENFDADLVDVADRLSNIADALRGGITDLPVVVAEPAGADLDSVDADAGSSDTSGGEPGQPRKAPRKSRPADVSDGASPSSQLSL